LGWFILAPLLSLLPLIFIEVLEVHCLFYPPNLSFSCHFSPTLLPFSRF
jgi:hypothetical protein